MKGAPLSISFHLTPKVQPRISTRICKICRFQRISIFVKGVNAWVRSAFGVECIRDVFYYGPLPLLVWSPALAMAKTSFMIWYRLWSGFRTGEREGVKNGYFTVRLTVKGGGGLLQMIIWRAVAVIEGITDSGSWVKIAFSLCKIRFRTHLGQIPQDVGNGQYVAFFKFFEALLWPNGLIFSIFLISSEVIVSVTF